MRIEENKSLKSFNTFGVDVRAKFFTSVTSVADLREALRNRPMKNIFILGGGSNMLLTKDIDAFVIHIAIPGFQILEKNDHSVKITVGGGEKWHDFVMFCVSQDFGGVENMSLIPGNVGTAPIQNIGAYGAELKDVFVNCKAIHRETPEERIFSKEEAQFGYRDSVFKSNLKNEYVITEVTFQLTIRNHQIRTDYGDIQKILNERNITNPSIKDVSDAVISIRQSKLPDPEELGNSGSFLKKPVGDFQTFRQFKEQFPEATIYEITPPSFKIPAGWLIEHVGYKGKRVGEAGVHKNQAFVLVNYGQATGKEILDLALDIQKTVRHKTGIFIEPEVNIF